MTLNLLRDLYYNSPKWIKTIYSKVPSTLRYRKEYLKWEMFLKKEFDDSYPIIKLRETLYIAQKGVPFYKKLYSQYGTIGFELSKLTQLEQLPLLDKNIIRNNYSEFINPNYSSVKSFYVTTGGSEGEPMRFLQSNNVWQKELAFIHNIFSNLRYKPENIKFAFRGVPFKNLPPDIFWQSNPLRNEIQFSPFHLTIDNIVKYANKMNEYEEAYLHGYPSAILNIIRTLKQKNVNLRVKINGIFLISENYEDQDVVEIISYFNCPALSLYGHSERLIIGHTIDKNCSIFKIDQRYGHFEIVDENGNSQKEFVPSQIVGTSFDNWSMPLIRYKTGDYTTLISSKKELLVKKISGRWENEFLEGKNGERITMAAINFHSEEFSLVSTYQFVQKKPGICELVLTAPKKLESDQLNAISKIVNLKIGHAIKTNIVQKDFPILTERGKQLKLIKA